MKIIICCSKALYSEVAGIQQQLEAAGYVVTLPNNFDNSGEEDEMRKLGTDQHSAWKAKLIRLQGKKVENNDAILVLNLEKHGQANYISGSTFLEMFKVWELGKKIYFWNDIPTGILQDEIIGFGPTVIHNDLSRIKE
jgi:hypothetical protein